MPLTHVARVRGLLLAAGEGRRFGGPKALARKEIHGPTLVESAIEVLLGGGCDGVTVVVGAAATEVASTVTALGRTGLEVDVLECADWPEGMGASLRAGLRSFQSRPPVEAALVTLVDLPDVGADVVRRLLAPVDVTTGEGQWRVRLARAAYGGRPGHPALIGRDHWDGVVAAATGDRGARDYYRSTAHDLVECGDLATGRDADRPEDLRRPS